MKSILAPAAIVLATAAAPAPDPVLSRVLAGVASQSATTTAFEVTRRETGSESGDKPESHVTVERFDGKAWSVVSRDGKVPSAKDAGDLIKARAGSPVPGYYRVATYLAAGARRTGEAAGRVTYHLDALPKGTINIGGDRSDKFQGDIIVDTSGAQPYVSRTHFYAPKPFSVMLVARIDSFDAVNEYGLGKDGRPTLLRAAQNYTGAKFGKVGTVRVESSFTPLK